MSTPLPTNHNYATTRRLTIEKPACFDTPVDGMQTLLKSPDSEQKIAEGGLRLQGLFKASTEDKPLITVITVVYNGAKFLEDTIKSVIEQTYDNVEYIIVDGGSTDGTIDIIKKHQHAIDYWVSEPDKGIYDAMNKGISLARGKIVGLINCGDKYVKNAVELVVASMVACPSIYTGEMVKFSRANCIRFKIARDESHLNYAHISMPINHPSTFVDIQVYKKIGFFDTSFTICADSEFILRAHLANTHFVFIKQVLSEMELGGISEKTSSLFKRSLEHYMIRKKYDFDKIQNLKYFISYYGSNIFKYILKGIFPKAILAKYYRSK